MGSPELNLEISESSSKDINIINDVEDSEAISGNIADSSISSQNAEDSNIPASDINSSKEEDSSNLGNGKKVKKKSRHGKKGHVVSKENPERSTVRRVHHIGTKFKQSKKCLQNFPSISKFFLPYKRPRKDAFIPPTKFLLGGNISDPLNLNSLQDEDINRAMNAVTPESSPLPTPPRHKAKIDVIIPPNIRDPLNLMEPLDNEEYEKRLELQQRKKTPRKKPRVRRRTTETVAPLVDIAIEDKTTIKEPPPPEPSTSRSRKRSCSDSDNNSQKGKDAKKLRRMESLDKIVSPVVPQPGAWMRARPTQRPAAQERPVSPHRTKLKSMSEGEQKLPIFHPKNSRYQYGNYDRYYGYRNLNAMMDIRLQVFEMHRQLFQNKDVLDIGCNVGHISIAVARTLGAKSVLGMDIDPVLIGRAQKNLRSFIPIPAEELKADDEKKPEDVEKKLHCNKCKEEKCDGCSEPNLKMEHDDDTKKALTGRKLKKPRKNRKSINKPEGQFFFPMSMSMMFGPLGDFKVDINLPQFPYNVNFKQGNYVPREDVAVGSMDSPQFDLILCLSTTKWMHLNWGDAGLKRAFRRMFNDLRPGGKLPTIYENFNGIELYPNKFREYLLSPEIGFSKCSMLGVPQHASKGFRRPIQLYVKGDFTPSKARWSDAYAPSSHHRPEAEPPRRTVYAPVAPAYRPSDDAPSCGAVTPYSPNLDVCADDSPFYNPRSDTSAPSYQPPRPTVYATLPSPLGGASPAPSPAASPAPAPGPAPGPAADQVEPNRLLIL
ncbi:unnamed protein product [Leptidea sinapis]|uniref:RNA methyltransferase n=1 Tax=Leptidea sinapis TaxID=189913 RepID=A0A5E4QN80_9NEOP|nr:unnamed protein product [Leptidea sinapis]